MEQVNLKKIASLLNLSVSTASKALRDSYEISDETKRKVLKLARELNYQPNPYASSLRKARSKTLAVIVPEIANNFFVSAINGIQRTAQSKGYHVLIYISHENSQYEKDLVNYLVNGRVDGVLISLSKGTKDVDHLNKLRENGRPVVMFDRVAEEAGFSTVTTDDFESSYRATEHLILRGCTRIGHCMISQTLSIGNKRLEGYKEALEKHGISFDPSLVVHCNLERETDLQLIRTMITECRPDGIFAAVESYALWVYEICKEMGLRIPDDIRVITFSNLATAHLLAPSLSTITQPAFEIGREAALHLIKSLEKSKSYHHEDVIIKSTLICRDSTN